MLLALPVGSLLASEFAALSPLDPVAVGGAVTVLALVAVLATAVPARRIVAVDPTELLRRD